MSKNELRGASRRQFLRGATAIGAALGWGPARLLDFIERGGGTAAADCSTKGIQNLVVFVGSGGAHGYPHFLFPHPDTFTDPSRYVENATTGTSRAAVHFLQDVNNGGMLSNPGMFPGSTWNNIALPNRWKRYYGVDNQAFGGVRSADSSSRDADTKFYKQDSVPSNTTMGPDKKFIVTTPHTPWIEKYGLKKAITAIDGAGINPFHIEGAHSSYVNFDKSWTMMAAAATIQLTRPSITPVILVGSMERVGGGGTTRDFYNPGNVLPGAPEPAIVSGADAMVDLFNSNATLAGGALSNPKNAVVYEAYVKGLIGSSKTAEIPTFTRGYRTGKVAANLVGLNLADQLRATDADRVRYGFTGNNPGKAAELRDRMIVAAKALKLGLTSQVCIKYFSDDPHGIFSREGVGAMNSSDVAELMSRLLNAFMDDLMSAQDPFCPGIKLGDNTVIAFIGDTPRTMTLRDNWNDPTVGGQNRTWIMSNGILKTGFFGGDRKRNPTEGGATNDHLAVGPGEGCLWDFKTGDGLLFDTSAGLSGAGVTTGTVGRDGQRMRKQCGEAAMAAILYAITRGDIRRVNDFYSGPEFPAVQVPVLL